MESFLTEPFSDIFRDHFTWVIPEADLGLDEMLGYLEERPRMQATDLCVPSTTGDMPRPGKKRAEMRVGSVVGRPGLQWDLTGSFML